MKPETTYQHITRGPVFTRLVFCRKALLSLLALPVLDGCLGSDDKDEPASYYPSHQSEFLETLESFEPHIQALLTSAYGKDFSDRITRATRTTFMELLPGIPYIGGDENGLTEDLVQAAMVLAFYRVMKQNHRSLDETGKLVYSAYVSLLADYPGFLFRWGWTWSGKDKNNKAAAVSKQRRYPGDWVSEYVEGDGKAYDWGIDHVECGTVKYLRSQGSPELAPYLCIMDLPTFSKAGAGLVRTTTIAGGADRCDFRFRNGRPTQLLDPRSAQILKRWGKTAGDSV